MTGATFDNPSEWALIDGGLKDSIVLQIVSILECAICLDVMHVPFVCSCGHSFCFGCLRSWLKNKLNCPTCRSDLKDPPVLNIHLRDVSKMLTETFIDSMEEGYQKQNSKDARAAQIREYEVALNSKKDLFGKSFRLVPTTLDTSDGVLRCGNCHWEAHGSICYHCGEPIRNPQDEDSEEDDDFEQQEEEAELYGVDDDNYDSEDSFIDTRELTDIQQDLSPSELWDSHGVQDGGSWNGFRSDSEMYRNDSHQSDIVLLGSDDDNLVSYNHRRVGRLRAVIEVPSDSEDVSLEELEYFPDTNNLENAIHRLHRNHLAESEIESDDDLRVISRSRVGRYPRHGASSSDNEGST